MDPLDELPLADTVATSKETDVVQRLFRQTGDSDFPEKPARKKQNAFLTTFYLTIVFAMLANPWADTVFENIPKFGGSPLAQFAVKMLIFLAVTFVLTKWVI